MNPATSFAHFEQIAHLADVIWREHYIPIVGKPQIDYMLEKYQSAKAMSEQVNQGFEYYLISFSNTPVAYISIKKEAKALFLSKIYVLSTYRGKKIGKAAMEFYRKQSKRLSIKNYQTYGKCK